MAENNNVISIFSTWDPVKIAIAKSLLDSTDIWYFAKGDSLYNMPFSLMAGPIQFIVKEEQAEQARELLTDLFEENND